MKLRVLHVPTETGETMTTCLQLQLYITRTLVSTASLMTFTPADGWFHHRSQISHLVPVIVQLQSSAAADKDLEALYNRHESDGDGDRSRAQALGMQAATPTLGNS